MGVNAHWGGKKDGGEEKLEKLKKREGGCDLASRKGAGENGAGQGGDTRGEKKKKKHREKKKTSRTLKLGHGVGNERGKTGAEKNWIGKIQPH